MPKPTWGTTKILNISSVDEARLFDTRQADREWLNPINMNELRNAVNKHSDTVMFDGVVYAIQYREKGIFLKRADGKFTPCGEVSYESVKNFRFEL
jgi:hypothetical protein